MAASLPKGALNTAVLRWVEVVLQLARGDIDPEAQPGEYVEVPMESIEFGRIAAQTAKQVKVTWHELLTLVTIAPMRRPDHEARARFLARIDELTSPAGADGMWEWATSVIEGANRPS